MTTMLKLKDSVHSGRMSVMSGLVGSQPIVGSPIIQANLPAVLHSLPKVMVGGVDPVEVAVTGGINRSPRRFPTILRTSRADVSKNPLLTCSMSCKGNLPLNQRTLIRTACQIWKRQLNHIIFPIAGFADVVGTNWFVKHQVTAAWTRIRHRSF